MRRKSEEVIIDETDLEDTAEVEDDTPPFDTGNESSELGRITRLIFKTNRNLGNHEHESVELEYTVAEGEEVEEAYNYVRDKALELLGIDDEE